MIARLLCPLLVLALAACGPSGPRLGNLAPSGAIPGGVPMTPPHTLSAGDQLEIRFPFDPDENNRVTVAMDGSIEPKQAGRVEVGGLTVPEATARLKARYATILRSPELSVTVRRFAPEVFYVGGWVRRPGIIRSDLPLTVARAITAAGGAKPGAKTGDVLVMRHDADGTVHSYSVALGPLAGAGGQDPLLKSFDVVYVPQTAITAVHEFARQYYENLPFSASFNVSPQVAPSIVVPRALTAPTPPPPVVAPP